jgi:hypothetical protein
MKAVISLAIVAMSALGACASTPQPPSSAAAPTLAAAGAGAPSLNRAPADIGCDSIGWPDEVEPFGSLPFRVDPAAADPVVSVTDTGVTLETWWVPGFEPGPDRSVVGPDGEVVIRDGEVLTLVPMQNPELHGYSLCITPTSLSVMMPANG